MRISDWSSDVCSSDLEEGRRTDPARDPDPDLARHDHRPQRRAAGGVHAGGVAVGQPAGAEQVPRTPAGAGRGHRPAAGLPDSLRLAARGQGVHVSSEEHTSELQSLMRNSYAVICFKKKKKITP